MAVNSIPVLGEAPPAAGPSARRSRRGTKFTLANLVLAGLFAAGIGCVYLLHLRAGPAVASAAQQLNETQVDTALVQLGAMAADAKAGRTRTRDLVASFYSQARQRQIPIERLKGNPFAYAPPQRAAAGAAAADDQPAPRTDPYAARAAEEAARELARAMDDVKKLRLQSVLSGGRPTAMISNSLLSEGQQIAGWTVVSIKPQQVTLQWKDKTHTLQME
jgi:hypothetical protein